MASGNATASSLCIMIPAHSTVRIIIAPGECGPCGILVFSRYYQVLRTRYCYSTPLWQSATQQLWFSGSMPTTYTTGYLSTNLTLRCRCQSILLKFRLLINISYGVQKSNSLTGSAAAQIDQESPFHEIHGPQLLGHTKDPRNCFFREPFKPIAHSFCSDRFHHGGGRNHGVLRSMDLSPR